MPDPQSSEKVFLGLIDQLIEENISNEQFGVSELADKVGMSRSNLLRKIKSSTGLSAAQYIRQFRLKEAMQLLRETSSTVSEVSYKVGFNSVSYFIKCFGDQYGYPPGEAGKMELAEEELNQEKKPTDKRTRNLIIVILLLVAVVIVLIVYLTPSSSEKKAVKKSIAVLPFINDSDDSTNIYIINGLMESILNNLQNIEDLRVISRTSVEKYRNNSRTIAEIAEELDANYIVEGSGQKIGDKILLNVQLIAAPGDNHLWAEQYSREAGDIFKLQQEVAKSIATQIEVIITPEEEARMDKVPTEDVVAYDYFLKGLDLLYKGQRESLEEAIVWFKKAVERDNEFARANAGIAIAYYFLDATQAEKQYNEQINHYADQALLFDPKLPQSLIAKALFYMNSDENEMAVPYLEKALEYNPNSALVINILSDFYTRFIPNTEKYLEYALQGIRLDIASHDSVTASYIYLHLSNAFIQTGFVKEAEKYINKSLSYSPDNLYSEYVKAFILFAKNRNLRQTKDLLVAALAKDSTRLDVMQEVGKLYYFMRDYETAYLHYAKFKAICDYLKMDIYQAENAKIGVVFSEMGKKEESEKYFAEFLDFAQNDQSIYQHLSLAAYYSYFGDTRRALDEMQLFSEESNYHYWIILFLRMDPLMDNIKQTSEFKKIFRNIETKFWNEHDQIKQSLEEKGLL